MPNWCADTIKMAWQMYSCIRRAYATYETGRLVGQRSQEHGQNLEIEYRTCVHSLIEKFAHNFIAANMLGIRNALGQVIHKDCVGQSTNRYSSISQIYKPKHPLKPLLASVPSRSNNQKSVWSKRRILRRLLAESCVYNVLNIILHAHIRRCICLSQWAGRAGKRLLYHSYHNTAHTTTA